MAVHRSPGYPAIDLEQAIAIAEKLYTQVRTSVTDREAAAKDLGYSGITGASAKLLADLGHYGLLERVGKAGLRVSQRTVDILWGDGETKSAAISAAAVSPSLFAELQQQFPDVLPSENQLKGFLHRRNFADVAIPQVIKSYTGTRRMVEEEAESKSTGQAGGAAPDSAAQSAPKADKMTETQTLPRVASAAQAVGEAALNRIDMNIQGDKVWISGLLDHKGIDGLEKKLKALRILLEVVHEANDTGDDNDHASG